jgi:hypothetical protein
MTNAPKVKRYSLPNGLFFAMIDIAKKHDISLREVEITLLRTILKDKYAFVCNHPQDKINISHTSRKSAYCSWCWTRQERVISNRNSSFASQRITFTSKKDFIEIEKEQDNPLLGIQYDKRGSM